MDIPLRSGLSFAVKLSKFGGNRVYVEPTTYQDVTDAVREFANELERNWIELDRIIGGGKLSSRGYCFSSMYL